ncbi:MULTISPECIES: hypothetical protein [Catenuloplanes]|uniref:FXSXX-COOH protein n=1 Tax=Catenuloplanes niger TaxID=587534 RepID=A0AAE3ZRR0_9ACTN|nr:hypothetical protein [Catenuloplanes niger]MDR7324712.1 hypothetical protein [Catenuloplanes niger]
MKFNEAAREESDAGLRDVRALPLGDLLTASGTELDGPLERVLRDLPVTSENLAAFSSAMPSDATQNRRREAAGPADR